MSLCPYVAESGARTHILGTIHELQKLGWDVIPYIVGDQLPESWIRKEIRHSGNAVKRFGIDIVRLGLSFYHMSRVLNKVGPVDWVYERFGVFQALGYPFKRRGIPWILETNAFFLEAAQDRRTLALVPLARKWELKVYELADAIVVVFSVLRDQIVEHGISPGKIIVVP